MAWPRLLVVVPAQLELFSNYDTYSAYFFPSNEIFLPFFSFLEVSPCTEIQAYPGRLCSAWGPLGQPVSEITAVISVPAPHCHPPGLPHGLAGCERCFHPNSSPSYISGSGRMDIPGRTLGFLSQQPSHPVCPEMTIL